MGGRVPGGWTAAEQDEIWARWQRRESRRTIGRHFGRDSMYVRRVLAHTGGRRPPPSRRREGQLTAAEREEVSRGLAAGESCRVIAGRLGRAPSTVSREVARNGGRAQYRAGDAEAAAWRRAERPKPAVLAARPALRAAVEAKLELRWSPEQIAHWLRRAYPDAPTRRVSHETIYLSLFVQGRGALRRGLSAQLRTRGRSPAPGAVPARRAHPRRAGPPPAARSGVDPRAARRGRGPRRAGTLGGRPRVRAQALRGRDARRAHEPLRAALPRARRLPRRAEALRRSRPRPRGRPSSRAGRSHAYAWDHGKEMGEHVRFTADTGVQVYLCDPRSPWQRGTNENTNGLLRQYLPKAADLSAFTQADLDAVATELTGRPRETLGWRTPAERFLELAEGG